MVDTVVVDSRNRIYISSELRNLLGVECGDFIYLYKGVKGFNITSKMDKSKLDTLRELKIQVYRRRVQKANGRIAIPMEFRQLYTLKHLDNLFMHIDYAKKTVNLKKIKNFCMACNTDHNLMMYGGIYLCKTCHSRFM